MRLVSAPMTEPHTLDAHLTAKARLTWPGAQVWIIDDRHVLQREGEADVILGTGGIGEAKRALSILREDAARD